MSRIFSPFRKRSRAVTPIVATILLIAVTLISGMAVFSYVNSEAGSSERALGTATASYLNSLNERFLIVNANFSSNKVTIWFYNNGNLTTKIQQIIVYNSTRSLYVVYSASLNTGYQSSGLPLTVATAGTAKITLTLPSQSFGSGRTYFIQATALYGNTYTYYQVR